MQGELKNLQLVRAEDDDVFVGNPRRRMNRKEALVHAAWLVRLAEKEGEFAEILKTVRET
jgi:hypothetical protein